MSDNETPLGKGSENQRTNNPFQLNFDSLKTGGHAQPVPPQQPAPTEPTIDELLLQKKKLEIQKQIEALQQSLLQQTPPQQPTQQQPLMQPPVAPFPVELQAVEPQPIVQQPVQPLVQQPVQPAVPQSPVMPEPSTQTGVSPSEMQPIGIQQVGTQQNEVSQFGAQQVGSQQIGAAQLTTQQFGTPQPQVTLKTATQAAPVIGPLNQPAGTPPVRAYDETSARASGSYILPRLFVALLVSVPVLLYSYWYTIIDLIDTWSKVIDYHHGFFVVPFVVYFLWSRRDTFPVGNKSFDYISGMVLGTLLIALCSLLRYQIMRYSMVSLDTWTILIWVFGATLIFFGVRVFIWAMPSLFFLAFMFPWPMTLETMLRRPLQEIAAKISVALLRIIGEPAVSSKNTIFLGDLQLDVAAACSGIRVLVSVVAAAYAAALLMRRPWWQNVLLFCMVIPVALVINAMRIAMTGLLIVHASGFVDRFGFSKPTPVVCDEISGIVMLILAFLSFVTIIFWLGKVFRRVTPVA